MTHPIVQHGGAERVIAEQLRAAVDAGDEVHLAAPEVDPAVLETYETPDAVETHAYGATGLGGVRALRRLFARLSPDVVFSHYQIGAAYAATLGRSPRPSTQAYVHGSLFWHPAHPGREYHRSSAAYRRFLDEVPGHAEFAEFPDRSLPARARAVAEEYLEVRGHRRADALFTNARHGVEELRGLYGVDAEVLRPGVHREWIESYDDVEPRALAGGDRAILSVCRLDPRKRLDLLVDAFARLCERRDDVALVLAGTGPAEEGLRRRVAERGVGGRVEFAGFVSEADLASYYKSADAFAYPGWASFGIAPLEAFAMRTPVAVSVDAFANEVIGDRPAARVLPPDADAWAAGLDELLDAGTGGSFDTGLLPTWEAFREGIVDGMHRPLDE